MNMLLIPFVIVSVAISAALACEYSVHDFKINPCDSKQSIYVLKNLKIALNKDCNLQIYGCVKWLKSTKECTVDYVAKKNGMQVLKGSKKACNENLWGTVIKCPMPENSELCATDKWIYEVPKGTLPMAVGNIDGIGTVKTDIGNFCYKVTAKIKKN